MSVWVLFIFLKMLFWMKAVFFMRLLLVFNQVFIWISDSVIAGSHCGALSEKELLFSHSVVSDSFETPWTIAHQAPLSMGFSRQEYWSGLPFPSLRDLSNPRIEPESPALQADSPPLSHWGSPLSLVAGVELSWILIYHAGVWDLLVGWGAQHTDVETGCRNPY